MGSVLLKRFSCSLPFTIKMFSNYKIDNSFMKETVMIYGTSDPGRSYGRWRKLRQERDRQIRHAESAWLWRATLVGVGRA